MKLSINLARLPFALGLALLLLVGGCKKDFLQAKTDKSLIVPTTLEDFSALLDNTNIMNRSSPSAQIIASDNIWLDDDLLASMNESERLAYTWEDRVNDYSEQNDWSLPYVVVFYSNVVLDGLEKIQRTPENAGEYDRLKGTALFFRGSSFFQLAEVFAPAYHASSAVTDLGIVLRLDADPNTPSVRATLEQTYAQIQADLEKAATLLPSVVSYRTRPVKEAAFGQLARVNLSMGLYEKAEQWADRALGQYSALMNYNDVDPALVNPFSLYNEEVIFQNEIRGTSVLLGGAHKVDKRLMLLYDSNDLRKTLFFEPFDAFSFSYYGSYGTGSLLFNGIATDELYLIKAECAARRGDSPMSLTYLNTLLINRYRRGTFFPLTASSEKELLELVLGERRKELLFRGLRWGDIKRLNREGTFPTTISREVGGISIELPPGDLRYQFLIPEAVITATSMTQNPR